MFEGFEIDGFQLVIICVCPWERTGDDQNCVVYIVAVCAWEMSDND